MSVPPGRRIGIDLGGTKIEGIVLGPENQPLVRERIATESDCGYERIIERITMLVTRLRQAAPAARHFQVGASHWQHLQCC